MKPGPALLMMAILTSTACSEPVGTTETATPTGTASTDQNGQTEPVQVTSEGAVTRHIAAGNLESTHDIGCTDLSQVKNVYSPADLFKGAVTCFQSGDDDRGIRLFWLALAYGRYDMDRVADETAHQGIEMLKISSFEEFRDADRVRISEASSAMLNAPEEWAPFCQQLRDLGPPAYHPDYMIQHGLRPFLPDSADSGNGLLPEFNPDSAWESIVDEYMRCGAQLDAKES